MIKKALFADEIMTGMDQKLRSVKVEQDGEGLTQATNYLHSAFNILEESGLKKQAEAVTQILNKITAKHKTPGKPKPNYYMRGLTPEKMTENLTHHGWVFNLADDAQIDDLLNAEIGDEELEVSEKSEDLDFEDEI